MADRVLTLLKPQFIGDAVMATPLLDTVASAHSESVAVCGPVVQELLADRAKSCRFETGEKISGIWPVFRAARGLRRLGCRRTFVVNRSFRSALAVRLAKIPERIGHATDGRSFLLTTAVPYDLLKFEPECFLDLARAVGLSVTGNRPKLRLLPTEAVEVKAEIGVQPGARYPQKQIPLTTLAEGVRPLAAKGHRIVLLGGLEEKESAAEFRRILGFPVLDWVGELALRQSMEVLAGLRLMVGSDTGLMHVAAALECPTLTVFGPNLASKWGHGYAPHRVLEAPEGRMDAVRPESIFEAAAEILGSPIS